jgi:hypothetical protein
LQAEVEEKLKEQGDLNKNKDVEEAGTEEAGKSEEEEKKQKILEEENKKRLEKEAELQRILDCLNENKKKGNVTINTNVDASIENYDQAIREVEEFLVSVQNDYENLLANSTFNEILNQRKLIYSNLALCYSKKGSYEQSLQLDSFIIQRLDPRFDKSYGRMIHSCIKLNNLQMADLYANQLKTYFSEATISKYQEFLTLLEIEQKKVDDELRKRIQKNKKVNILK